MRNIQVIDAADNCVYDIFSATEEQFALIFRDDTDIAFIDEVEARLKGEELERAFFQLWNRRVRKIDVLGIHGVLFYGLEKKKGYYPTRKDEEAKNLTGSPPPCGLRF